MKEFKGQITVPFSLLVIAGIMITIMSIAILYIFLPNFSFAKQYNIYSITSTNSTTMICSNFNETNINSIVFIIPRTYGQTNATFLSSNVITREFLLNENCFVYNIGYSIFNSTSSSPQILSGYVVSNNGARNAIKFIKSNYVSEQRVNKSFAVNFVNLTVSSYIVNEPTTITANAITNINNPFFSFFIDGSQIPGCQSISTNICSIEISNITNNTDAKILVYAFNSTVTASNKVNVFVTK